MNTIKCLFETILNISSPEIKYQLPPPPPHEPSQKFLSPDPGKSTPLPRKYCNPPETFQTIEKKSQTLKLTQTQPLKERKCYPPVEYPPPPKKTKNKPNSQPLEKTKLYISEKKCHLLSNN